MARKLCQEYSSDAHLMAGGIWKGDVLVADVGELGKLDASEVRARRLNALALMTSQEG